MSTSLPASNPDSGVAGSSLSGQPSGGTTQHDRALRRIPRPPRMRSPRILHRYVAKEFLFCFSVSFLFFFAVFFVNQLLLMAEDILAKRAPVGEVLLLLLFATPSILAIACPFASLVGALMASSRLSSDNEILASLAAGIRTRTVFRPFIILGIAIAALSFVFSDIFLPLGTLEFGKLYRKLIASTPEIELGPYAVKRFGQATVVTGAMRDKDLGDILVFDSPRSGERRILGASRAGLEIGQGSFEARLDFESVWEHSLGRDKMDGFEWATADSLVYRIKLRERDDALVEIGPREMASRDLATAIAGKWRAYQDRLAARRTDRSAARGKLLEIYEAGLAAETDWRTQLSRSRSTRAAMDALAQDFPPDRSLQIYRLELAKKFSIPAGALFFVFLAFPLGLGTRRSGRSVGFGLGLLVSVLYWALLLLGQTLGTRFDVDPDLAMWMPNLVAIVAGGFFWAYRTSWRRA